MKSKKSLFFLLAGLLNVSLFFSSVSATNYYVSPTGTTSAAGTLAAPLAFSTAISKALVAGDSVFLRGGTYSFTSTQTISKSGSSAKNVFIGAYQNEIPVLDFRGQVYNSSSQGVKVSGNYIHFKGITVQGAGDNGIQVTGSYNRIELCVARWNCDSGFQMKTGSDNYIINCDSYENFDYESMNSDGTPNYGGNADGFADKQYTNTGTNHYKGCRAWRNADDGWDHFELIGNTTYDSCWCYANGPASYDMKLHIRFKTDSTAWFSKFKSANFVMTNYGNGNGFKLGGNYTAHQATLHDCVSVLNTVKGFDQNNNAGTMNVYNCIGYMNNPDYGFSNSTYGTLVAKNCASLGSKSSNKLSSKSVTQAYNSWNSGFSCAATDFLSVDYTQLLNARQADGSLPEISFLHQKSTSNMIDKGVNLGYSFSGTAPDLGAFEYKVATAVESVSSEAGIRIYPNPVADKVIVSMETVEADKVVVSIFDTMGRQLIKQSANEVSGQNEVNINTSMLAKGNYIIRVSGKNINFSSKLIK